MGWWRIDPETGEPLKDGHSRLSRPPDFALLNAVPGVDNEEETHYLGDGPWDMVYSAACKIRALIVGMPPLSEDEVRQLFLDRVIPQALRPCTPESASELLRVVDELWKDIDWCYEEDWDRPATAAEKRWVCGYAVKQFSESK